MASDMLQQFKALRSREERLDALQKLVEALNSSERAAVASAISRRNDVVCALPLELVIGVFNYLHLLDAWTLQRVCKRWRKVLSSGDFMRAALSRWDTHDPADSGRSLESVANDSIESKVRHMQALRLGRPFTIAVLDETGTAPSVPHPPLSQRKLDLKGDKIVYVSSKPGHGDTVTLHHLGRGSTTFHGEARERIMSTTLTTSLVAFVSFEGLLYIAPFSDTRTRPSRVQLPSSRIRGMGGHGEFVALAVGGDNPDSASVPQVLLYDSRAQRLRSFEVAAECKALEQNVTKLNSCSILVDSIRETIDVFSLVLDMGTVTARSMKSLKITHLRVTFDGEVTSSSSWYHHVRFDTAFHAGHFAMTPTFPTGVQKVFRMHVCALPFMGGLPLRLKFSVLFDSERAGFIPNPADVLQEPMPTWRASGIDNVDERAANMDVVWKDILVRPFQIMNSSERIEGIEYHSRDRNLSESWLEYISLINDTFMVSLEVSKEVAQRSRIRISCYDEHVHVPGAVDTGLWDLEAAG